MTPVNGELSGVPKKSYYVGDVAQFTCNNGFKIRGLSMLKCGKDGSWTGSVPICEGLFVCATLILQVRDCAQ